MGLLDIIGNVATGGILGSITGIIGSIGTGILNYKTLKAKQEHEIALIKAKSQAGVQEAMAKIKVEQAKADAEALVKSYDTEKRPLFMESYMQYLPDWIRPVVAVLFAFIDALRMSVRPLLAYALVGITATLGVIAYQQKPQEFIQKVPELVTAITYMTIMVISWYFGHRMNEKFMNKFIGGDK